MVRVRDLSSNTTIFILLSSTGVPNQSRGIKVVVTRIHLYVCGDANDNRVKIKGEAKR